jgi:signal transduction histidine kinase
MRAVCVFLAIVGGCALVAGTWIALAVGHLDDAAWMLAGVAPMYVAGLIGAFLKRGRRIAFWLIAGGALSAVGDCLGISITDLPAAAGSASAWLVLLIAECVSNLSVVAGIGLIGLFPTGVPQTRGERVVLGTSALVAVLVPVALMASSHTPPAGLFQPAEQGIVSPLFAQALRPAEPVLAALQFTLPAWIFFGLGLLYLRYRRSAAEDRRRIRWLLVGGGSALIVFVALSVVATFGSGTFAAICVWVLWVAGLVLILGSLAVALADDGVLDIDRTGRRSVIYRALWALIAVVYVAAATALGILASRYLPVGVAMLLAAGAALAFQPVQRRLERLADRWVFGQRLDGYTVITRFGATLETSPSAADLLPRLANAIRQGLNLEWVRVRVDTEAATAGIAPGTAADPACVVPLIHAGTTLGRIECGPRHDGPLLEEDRRLLAHLAGQAATAASNVRLTAELTDRVGVIRRQAAELTASRARIAQAQDAERQRLQRDLHDGAQQDIVALTAKLALARERLRRGDSRADESLAELQRDLGDLLAALREFAHSIHPPVLADQGLLEAIEAQAARLPLEVVIEADPALRGVRYPAHIETTTWYVVAEALTNAVKHADAQRVLVALAQPDGHLTVEVRDDGRGFDPAAARGLGLAGLADRVSIVNGALRISSKPGAGTTLHAEIPLSTSAAAHG